MADFFNMDLILAWLINPLIWLVIIFFSIGVIILFLFWRKKRKLKYPAVEIVMLGNGKTSFNFLGKSGAGWFGKSWWGPGKLWDIGEEVMRTKDMEIIEEFSEEDFQEVNGQRGVAFFRNPERKMFFPISKLNLSEKDRVLIAQIAPAIYTETAADILKKAEEETKNTWEKVAPYIVLGVIILFAMVSIIVITQMVTHAQERADKTVLEAGKTCLENARMVCSQIAAVASGSAP